MKKMKEEDFNEIEVEIDPEMEKKLMKKLNVIMVLLTITILLTVGMVVKEVFLSKDNPEEKNNISDNKTTPSETNKPTEEQEEKEEEISLSDEKVVKAIRILAPLKENYIDFIRTTFNVSYVDNYFAPLYKKDILYAADLDDKIKMFLTVNNSDYKENGTFIEYSCNGSSYQISEETLEKTFKQIFGKKEQYKTVEYNIWAPFLKRVEDNLIIDECGDDIIGPSYWVYSKVTRATTKKDELYLYELVGLVDETRDYGTWPFPLYNDVNRSKLLGNTTENEIFTKYEDSLSEYKYTYKLEDGNYYFYKVERIR